MWGESAAWKLHKHTRYVFNLHLIISMRSLVTNYSSTKYWSVYQHYITTDSCQVFSFSLNKKFSHNLLYLFRKFLDSHNSHRSNVRLKIPRNITMIDFGKFILMVLSSNIRLHDFPFLTTICLWISLFQHRDWQDNFLFKSSHRKENKTYPLLFATGFISWEEVNRCQLFRSYKRTQTGY